MGAGADYGVAGVEPEPEEELPPGFVEDPEPAAEPAAADVEELPPGFVEDAPVDPEELERDKDEQIRALFAPTLGAGVNPEKRAGILELARQTGVKADVVESNYDSMKAAWEKARFNPREYREKNPQQAELALARPDLGPLIVRDKSLNFLQKLEKGLLEFAEWSTPFMQSMALEGEEAGITEQGKKELERLRTPQTETVRQDVVASGLTGLDRAAVPFIQLIRSRKSQEQSLLGAQLLKAKMQGQDTWALEKQLADMQSSRELGTYDYGSGPIEQTFVDAADVVASQAETMGAFGKVGGTAALVAGGAVAAATRNPKLAGEAALWAGSFFGRVGSAAKSFQLESGSAYLEIRGTKTDDGRLIDDNVAVGTAIGYGIVSTAIEQGLLGLELKNLGPLGEVLRTGSRKAFMATMLKDAGFVSIAKSVGRAWLANAAGEATEEGLQDAAQQIFTYLGRSVSQGLNEDGVFRPQAGPAWDPETTAEVMQKTFGGMLVTGAPGASLNATTQAVMLDAAKKGGEQVQAIIGAAKDSPTVKAAPQAVAKLIEKTTSHVYVDAEAFTKLFQENDADPADAARELMGPKGPQLLADAVAAGENLQVPIADYLEKWAAKPIAEALAEDTQTKPGLLTPRKAAEFSKAIEQHAETLAKESAKEDAAPSQFERRFVDAMELRLQDQGVVGKDQVRAAMTPMRAFLRTMADRSGKTVDELFGHVRLGTGEQGPTGGTPQSTPPAASTPTAPPVPAAPAGQGAQPYSGITVPEVDPQAITPTTAPGQENQAAEAAQAITPEDEDASFDFGANVEAVAAPGPTQLDEVKAVISRMRPDNREVATQWLAYAAGETTERPPITPAMEKKLARYGVVDPQGFNYAEDGRSLERKVTSRKVRGEMPEEFRRQRLEKLEHALGTTLNYYYQGEGEAVAALLEHFAALPEAEQLRRFYIDENTGLLNGRAFTRSKPEGKSLVGHISIEGTKFQNDTAGHQAGDRLYRAAGQALQELSPEAAKVGGDFVVWVADQAELDGIVANLTKNPALGGYQATGVVGPDVKEAGKAHAGIKAAAEEAGTRAKRGQRPKGAVEGAVFASAEPKISGIPTRLVEAFRGIPTEEAAREVYVEPGTGLLTGEGFFALPRKKHQASIDLNGLKVINQLFGDQAGDELLEIFGTYAQEVGGPAFDFAHLHGDEYAAQSDDLGSLQTHLALFREFLQNVGVGGADQNTPSFAFGLGSAFDEADRNLNAAKEELTQRGQRGDAADARRAGNIRARGLGGEPVGGREGSPQEGRAGDAGAVQGEGAPGDAGVRGELGARPEDAGRRGEVLPGQPGSTQQQVEQTFFQDPAQAIGPRWFSAVGKSVADAKQAKGDARSWLAVISKTAGVKKEELELLGLPEWLEQQSGAITREAVAAFVEAHNIPITERILGDPASEISQERAEQAEVTARLSRATLKRHGIEVEEDGPDIFFVRDSGAGTNAVGIPEIVRELGEEGVPDDELVAIREAGEALRRNAADRLPDPTRYEDYTLGGHTPGSYKEILLYTPGSKEYAAPHFDAKGKGLLAHARITEHKLANGDRVLMVEEIQSDLHQAGREHGYGKPVTPAMRREADVAQTEAVKTLSDAIPTLGGGGLLSQADSANILGYLLMREDVNAYLERQRSRGLGANSMAAIQEDMASPDFQALVDAARARREEHAQLLADKGKSPDAPFKTTWEELVAKRLVRYAAEKGYSKIAWATGEQQAARYDLSKKVGRIVYNPKGGVFRAYGPDSSTAHSQNDVTPEMLPGIIGQGLAQKLLASAPGAGYVVEKLRDFYERTGQSPDERYADRFGVISPSGEVAAAFPAEERAQQYAAMQSEQDATSGGHVLEGEDIRIGGEGMKLAYDKRIPGLFDKIVKKFGGKVTQEPIAVPANLLERTARGHTPAIGETFRRHIQDDRTEEYVRQPAPNFTSEQREYVWGVPTQTPNAGAGFQPISQIVKPNGPTVWTAELPAGLREKALREGMALFQEDDGPAGPRGFATFIRNGTELAARIVLNKGADVSTVLHESGHVFLELMRDIAAKEDAPVQVKEDWATILKQLGVENPDDIKREHHEKFAKWMERYFYEGTAPTPALTRVFTRLRLWLKSVYQTALSLGELPEEVRDTFDRMFATDEEIARTESAMGLSQLFRSPEEAGMSPEEWATYLETQEKARSHAADATRARVLKDKLRETEGWWKAEEAKLRKDALKEHDALPASKALRYIKKGELEVEGGKVSNSMMGKLDRDAVETLMGKERAKALFGNRLVKEGGEHPDAVAELLGFPTGKAMLDAISTLPEQQGWAKEKAHERMLERHPDILQEREKLRELAAKGLHGDFTSDWLLREWAALRKKAGTGADQAQAPVEAIQRAAKLMVERRQIRSLEVGRALQAERSAADAAARAAAKGDFAQAFVFKQQQLLNHYVYREATEAREMRDSFEALAGALGDDKARARLGKASPAYRDVVDQLLESLNLREPENRETPPKSVGELVTELEANGDTVAFDPEELAAIINEPVDWRLLTVGELRNVFGALKNIKQAATNKNTAIIDGKRVDKAAVVAQLVAEASTNLPDIGPAPSSVAAMDLIEKGMATVSAFDGELLRPETMLSWLGGGQLKSMWMKAIFKPLNDAKHREADLLKSTIKPILEAMEKLPKELRSRMGEKVDGAALFPGHRTDLSPPTRRFELLAMALNAGNESNLQRLTQGRGISEKEVFAALELLTKEEMEWVQATLDAAESLWPLTRELEERDTGLVPEKIQAKPMKHSSGSYRGGYWPAVYDRRVAITGERQAASTLAGLMDPSYSRPGTSHSHTKARADDFADVIVLDLSVVQAHMAQVAHDLAFREAVKSVGGLILNPQVQGALKGGLGLGRAKVFLQWVKDAGQMRGAEVATHAKEMTAFLNARKSNMAVAVLGYAVDIVMGDLSNPFVALSATDLKAKHLAAGMSEFLRSPVETLAFVHEKSGELRFRDDSMTREFARRMKDITKSVGPVRNAYNHFVGHAFTVFEWSEKLTTTGVWMGAYRQAIQGGETDADAVTYADSIVRKVVPPSSALDRPEILRNKGLVGALLLFHGYMNTVYNLMRDASHPLYLAYAKGETAGEKAKGVASEMLPVSAKLLGIIVSVSLLSEFLSGKGPEPEDGEDPLERYAKWAKRKLLMAPVQAVPFLGPVVEQLTGQTNSTRAAPGFAFAAELAKAVKKAGDGDAEAWDKAVAITKAVGVWGGAPVARTLRAADYIHDLLTGERTAEDPADVASGVIYGERDTKQGANPLRPLGGQ